ncbi:hypothetical protein EON65_16590 [archaeon]|nr:MAG: hypothetical protein EON65_16590 [archaeon]
MRNVVVYEQSQTELGDPITDRVGNQTIKLPIWVEGLQIQLELALQPKEYNHLIANGHFAHRLCLSIDASPCQCHDRLQLGALITLESTCIPSKSWSFMWFSITMHSSDMQETVASTPIKLVQMRHESPDEQDGTITLVATLTIDDLSRMLIQLKTLQQISADVVYEMLVYVPDAQLELVAGALRGVAQSLAFTLRCIAESTLFSRKPERWTIFPYGLQMAIKLLAAQHVHTSYYLVLDADVFLLRPFELSQLIAAEPPRAVYRREPWSVHSLWWQGSRALLGLGGVDTRASFGVTPALLSTWGSMLTTQHIKAALCSRASSNQCAIGDSSCAAQCSALYEEMWLDSFGRVGGTIWTEYTLYRTVLDHYNVSVICKAICRLQCPYASCYICAALGVRGPAYQPGSYGYISELSRGVVRS